MARKIRIEYAGAAYPVMARGNQGQDIYADERDRKLWLAETERAAGIGVDSRPASSGGSSASSTLTRKLRYV